jgi:hypothetical protein
MAQLKNLSVSGAAALANAPAAANHPIRKGEFDSQIQTLVDEQGAISSLLAQLRSDFEGNVASVLLQIQTLVDADGSLSTLLIALRAEFEDNVAQVGLQLTALTNADQSLAELIATLRAEYEANSADLLLQLTALADANQSLSQALIALQTNFESAMANVSLQLTALSNANGATSSLVANLRSEFEANVASVSQTLTTLANASGSQSSAVTNLTATVNGLTAALTEEATVRANADGTLFARWGVTMSIGNPPRVAGVSLMSGSDQQSTFGVLADHFELLNPAFPANSFPQNLHAFVHGSLFVTGYGTTGQPNVFRDAAGAHSRQANVQLAAVLKGVGIGSGFDPMRVRRAGTNVVRLHFSAQIYRGASIWVRIPQQSPEWRLIWAPSFAAPRPSPMSHQTVTASYYFSFPLGAYETAEFGYNGITGNSVIDWGIQYTGVQEDLNNLYNHYLLIDVTNF